MEHVPYDPDPEQFARPGVVSQTECTFHGKFGLSVFVHGNGHVTVEQSGHRLNSIDGATFLSWQPGDGQAYSWAMDQLTVEREADELGDLLLNARVTF